MRFIIFGIGGFWLLIFSFAELALRFTEAPRFRQDYMSPFLSLPLIPVAGTLILFGVGELRRWLYVLVFISIPAAVGAIFLVALVVLPFFQRLLPNGGVGFDIPIDPKLLGMIIFSLIPGSAAVLTYRVVNRHYGFQKRSDVRSE